MIFFAEAALTGLIIAVAAGAILGFCFLVSDGDPKPGTFEDWFMVTLFLAVLAGGLVALVAGAIFGIHAVWSL